MKLCLIVLAVAFVIAMWIAAECPPDRWIMTYVGTDYSFSEGDYRNEKMACMGVPKDGFIVSGTIYKSEQACETALEKVNHEN